PTSFGHRPPRGGTAKSSRDVRGVCWNALLMNEYSPAYHLVRPRARAAGAPVLDAAQQAGVDHAGLPLLVLAGPGTGTTTAIVDTRLARIPRAGIDPGRQRT